MRVISLHEFANSLNSEYRARTQDKSNQYLCTIAKHLYGDGAEHTVQSLLRECYPQSIDEFYKRDCGTMAMERYFCLDSKHPVTPPHHKVLRWRFLDRLLRQPDRLIVIPKV